MKVLVILAAAAAVALAAPTDPGQTLVYGVRRSKKSAYGAPCAGSAPLAPIALYLSPQPQQGYGGAQHYREEEIHEAEHEHPSARSYYEPSAVAASVPALNVGGQAASGPAVGVFPNAKVGGCAVPLLLSCAPNVVSGQLVKHHGYAAPAYAAPAYRDADNMSEMKEADGTEQKTWVETERAAHHQPAHHEAAHHVAAHHEVEHQNQHLAAPAAAPHHLHPASMPHQKVTSHHQ